MSASETQPQLPHLTIVVPCYNEEAVLPLTIERLTGALGQLLGESLIGTGTVCFVDDGSRDRTWSIIEKAVVTHPTVQGLKLSRNFGHQNALLAGLLTVEGDMVVSIDADLQDDVTVIRRMVQQARGGYDIVYGVRRERQHDSFFKRVSAKLYYRLLLRMGVNIKYNHADFRLLSRRALEVLKRYDEVNLFLRGLIPTIGFASINVDYDRKERSAGDSKYSLLRMLALAVDGITSFSMAPLRMIAALGFLIFIASLLLSAWVVWVKLTNSNAVPGWASSLLPIYFLGGVQLFSIGVVGEYVAKTYMEAKRRPRYVIESRSG